MKTQIHPAVKTPRAIVSVPFEREAFESVSAAARQRGLSISRYIRECVLGVTAGCEPTISATGGLRSGSETFCNTWIVRASLRHSHDQ